MSGKKYIKVNATFNEDGTILPTEILWEDNNKYTIDRILDIRHAASLKAGGCGIRYTCRIKGKERYLFLEDERWFIEAK